MALTTVSSQGIGFVTGRRNLIINGAMQVAQRGTSSTSAGFETVDRFEINRNNTDQIATTQSQSTTAPDGFAHSYKHVATTAETTVDADERVRVRQNIEAQNLQHLKYGTSGAEKVTLSFYVRSNVTGTYACNILGDDASRQIGGTYTINTADTWERKEITFDGDTATHTIANDNGIGFTVSWYLLAGTDYTATDNTSWGASATGKEAYGHTADWGEDANDEWYITGVQLEVGSRASDFEHLSYGEDLQLCMRYLEIFGIDPAATHNHQFWGAGRTLSLNRVDAGYSFCVPKTAFPALQKRQNQGINVNPSNTTNTSFTGTVDVVGISSQSATTVTNVKQIVVRYTGGMTVTAGHNATVSTIAIYRFDSEL